MELASNCTISGTPLSDSIATVYTISAANTAGTGDALLTITVKQSVVDNPIFTPSSGSYNTGGSITISTTISGANLYYTTDGSSPTTSSNLFSTALNIWQYAGKTIKVYATKNGYQDSEIISGIYSLAPYKTNQTNCFDGNTAVTCTGSHSGQDAYENKGTSRSFSGPIQHSTHTTDYYTVDNVSGLIWTSCWQGRTGVDCLGGNASLTMAWADAVTSCNSLNSTNSGSGYAEISNWRLPTRYEIQTIMVYNQSNKSMDPTFFPNPLTGYNFFWTSSEESTDATKVWLFRTADVHNRVSDKIGSVYTRCVSGPDY